MFRSPEFKLSHQRAAVLFLVRKLKPICGEVLLVHHVLPLNWVVYCSSHLRAFGNPNPLEPTCIIPLREVIICHILVLVGQAISAGG